jgi:hypothetical protein
MALIKINILNNKNIIIYYYFYYLEDKFNEFK